MFGRKKLDQRANIVEFSLLGDVAGNTGEGAGGTGVGHIAPRDGKCGEDFAGGGYRQRVGA